MTWWLLGVLVGLAAHALVSTAVAIAAAGLWPLAARLLRKASPSVRAGAAFGLALAPSATGIVAVAAVVLPAWLAREPRGSGEPAGLLLWIAALCGAAVAGLRAGSALRLVRRTARAVATWTRGGTPLHAVGLPATRFEHPLPVAALVGVRRPRLLLADRLVLALEPDELQAVAAHELGHAAARDNLRRLLLAASPDVLAWLPTGASLRREFERAAEAAADRRALRLVRPETLARALLKAAALAPAGRGGLSIPLATFDGAAPLAERVRALLEVERREPEAGRGHAPRIAVAAAALALGALAATCALRPEAHAFLEAIVRAVA